MRCRPLIVPALLGLVSLAGCTRGVEKPPAEEKRGIFGKTTQDVGEFKPEVGPGEGKVVSDHKIKASDPITAPLVAYGPITERTAVLAIDHALGLFNATEGRYPTSHQEFMDRIIKENNIRLPVLPGGAKYQYNVEQHQLVVIKDAE